MTNIVKYPAGQSWSQPSSWWPPNCPPGPGVPPDCGCGFGGLMQCWQDIAQFQQFLQCMLSQMGPYPVQGVTDGSAALPGNIGEYMDFTVTQSVTLVASVSQIVNFNMGVLSPGDWDVMAFLTPSLELNVVTYVLSPQPTGFSTNMAASQATTAGPMQPEIWATLASARARASITVPTLIVFAVNLGSQVASTGNVSMNVTARRMR
jgi:hypothetical protein